MRVEELLIDPDFEQALRPQTAEEADAMRLSVDVHGYLHPLICWQKDAKSVYLCDGHHRYRDWLRRVEEHKALPKAGMLGLLGKRGPVLPNPPDFLRLAFKDKEAVLAFIVDSQQGRRNLNEMELALLRSENYHREKMKVPEAEAARRTAEEYGVSVATVRRDGELGTAVATLAPIVAAQTGKDLKKVVTASDGPGRAQIVKASKILTQNLLTAQGVQQVVDLATTPASRLRLDVAEDGKVKPPAWEKPLASFESILKKIWAEDDKDQKKAVRQRMAKLLGEFFPAQAARVKIDDPKADEVSAC